ncbi:MAG TPA: hypothetical protein VNU71_13525 [Burkholderiaceae bacterium]|nr:hypothetical protein [Burkholderiaceae bacterium]
MDTYTKTTGETVRLEFDMREFALSVLPASVTYMLRADPGTVATDATIDPDLLLIDVSGGKLGRVYKVGIEATSSDGDSKTDMRKVRIVDPALVPAGPLVGGLSDYADDYADDYA